MDCLTLEQAFPFLEKTACRLLKLITLNCIRLNLKYLQSMDPRLPVVFKEVSRQMDFYIVPSMTQEVYLGLDFWRSFAIAAEIIPAIETLHVESQDDKQLNFHQ